MLCAWIYYSAFVKPQKMLEWPFLAAVMWGYFYVYMSYDANTSLADYISEYSVIGQITALMGLVGIYLGWGIGLKRKVISTKRQLPKNMWLLCAGLFFVIVGILGARSVGEAASKQIDVYNETSAYYYLLFYVGFPGLAMAVWAGAKWNGKTKYIVWIIIAIFLFVFIFPYIQGARRGPVFPAIILLLIVPSMARRKSPNPIVFASVLISTGIAMILFLSIRSITYNGGDWSDAIAEICVKDAVSERGKKVTDNEFVNHCHTVATLAYNGKINYGTGHLGLLLHWIPKKFYPNKPILGDGYFCSFYELFDDIERHCGVYLLGGSGASNAGVADSFFQYGWLFPFYWYCISYIFSILYTNGQKTNDPRWCLSYVGVMCASHWLISQSLSAATVPGLIFIVIPIVSIALSPKVIVKTKNKEGKQYCA